MQWTPIELHFESNQSYPWWEFPVTATFTHEQTGTKLTTSAYFDGDKRYVMQFAPPLAGTWQYRTTSEDAGLADKTGTLIAVAPTPQQISANTNLRGHVKVSKNGRYFEYSDGTPFFLLGDTNWSINTARCGLGKRNDGPFFEYLDDRKSKGFNTILMAYMRGFGDTNEAAGQRNEGGYPFVDGNTKKLNAQYFQSLDTRMRVIWERGFVVAAHPTWFAKLNCFFDHQSAKRISAYLAVRYGAYNALWSLSGEYQYTMRDCGWTEAQLNQLGNEVQKHNPYHHPVSIHPSGNPKWAGLHGSQSSQTFHDSLWLDHHWLQTGQKLPMIRNVARRARENYDLSPVKPVFLSESYYERYLDAEHAYHSRLQAWTALLSGSAGYGYGAFGMWQFYSPNDPSGETGKKTANVLDWKKAIQFEGSQQMTHVRDLFTSLPWWSLRPNRESISINGESNPLPTELDFSPPHSAQTPRGTTVIYVPRGNGTNTLRINEPPQGKFTAYWVDPRSGERTLIAEAEPYSGWMIPPRPDPKQDWVLLLIVDEGANDSPSVTTENLFNGKDLRGWHADIPDNDDNPDVKPSFIVRDGMLVSLGTPQGHLITDASHQNYRLVVQYRFAGKPGNCGVLVHASTPRSLYKMFPKSIEVQMNQTHAGDFWCIVQDITVPDMVKRRGPKDNWGITEGKGRRILNLTDGSEKPVGQWNEMVIECVQNEVKVWVNGDFVNHGKNCTAAKGQIAVQAEGSEVEFRKLDITPIEKLSADNKF